VPTCTSCGHANPEGASFCNACGAALAAAVPERRKLATLLFCDVSGSTAMGERLDPESVRELMFRYFHEMREAIERHGGTVEKFVGDAVMAVFGVPLAHEDDALRAVRAASEMRERLERLNPKLERRFGASLALRIGVNSGEVVAGDVSSREAVVTGDAVNTAARLEQAAAPGEILLGERTLRLARGALEVERVEPVHAKGKAEPVAAYRLLALAPSPPLAPVRVSLLVGRENELAALERHFDQAVSDGRCRLATIVGEPGVGKSRLASELIARVDGRAAAYAGRCLPYGEGITFWPMAEIVRRASSIRDEDGPDVARNRIGKLVEGHVAERISAAIGLGGDAIGLDVIALAFRRLFEALAAERPLILLLEDVHWAQETLLDLLGRLGESIRAPVLLMCTARPELADSRPSWPATMRLQPLGEEDVDRLLEPYALEEAARRRVVATARGNPLFVEELAIFLRERPEGGEIPDTLAALLTARLDLLPEPERAAAERASVEGEIFHQSAVAALSGHGVQPELGALLRRDILRPAEARFVDDAAFQFKHILIRDAAYRGIAKKMRAELHEGFAQWLEHAAGARLGEFEEFLGYHLEQAYRYREELGPVDERAQALAAQAFHHLAAAGLRAFERGDMPATANLLSRAIVLSDRDDPRRLELIPPLAEALVDSGEPTRADAIVEEASERARRVGADQVAARLDLFRAGKRRWSDPAWFTEHALSVAEHAMELLARYRDDAGLASAWNIAGLAHLFRGQLTAQCEAHQRALQHARRARATGGPRRGLAAEDEFEARHYLAYSMALGPTPWKELERYCRGTLTVARDEGHLQLEASCLGFLALVQAESGQFEPAREGLARARGILEDLGQRWSLAVSWAYRAAQVEMVAGEPAAAERVLRWAYETLTQMGDKGVGPAVRATQLADALLAQGRDEEALAFTEISEKEAAGWNDALAQVYLRTLRPRLLARSGEFATAETLAREAVEIADATEFHDLRTGSRRALAEVLRLSGQTAEAAAPLGEAIRLYEHKGSIVSARRVRSELAELSVAT
jgi:class 3 adenylate cyclase